MNEETKLKRDQADKRLRAYFACRSNEGMFVTDLLLSCISVGLMLTDRVTSSLVGAYR